MTWLTDILDKLNNDDVQLFSYNKDDYQWEGIGVNECSDTYDDLKLKISDTNGAGYYLNNKVWKNWISSGATKAYINASILKKEKAWIVEFNAAINSKYYGSNSVQFKNRDQAASAVQQWFDEHVFKKQNADNELMTKIYSALGK